MQDDRRRDHRLGVPSTGARDLSRDFDVAGLISALKDSRDLRSCKRHHIDAVEKGLCSNILVANTLIRVYARCGSLADARSVFESLEVPDVVSWNALLQGYVENGESRQALVLLGRMEQEGCLPDGRTFVTALKACSSLATKEGNAKKVEYVKVAKVFYCEAIDSRQLDIFVANTLVDTLAKCGSLEDARLVFERMPGHDVVSWTVLVLGHVDNEQCETALELFELMHSRGCIGNARTFSSALTGCSRLADKEEAKLVDGSLVKAESLEVGMAIHSRASSSGCDSDVFVGNTLLDMYVKCGSMIRARRVFDGMKLHDVVSWTTLIQGYAENGEPVVALQLYARMKLAGCKPDSRCYVAALLACSSLAAAEKLRESSGSLVTLECLDKTRMVYQEAVSSGFGQDMYVNTAAVRAYSKCGSSAGARVIFDNVAHRDTFLWNAMLLGHVENGESDSALGLVAVMQEQGHKGDARTLSTVLTACANLGVKAEKAEPSLSDGMKARYLEQGMALHLEASNSGFDKSDIFVGNALVDMYAKCGSLERATEVFRSMPRRDVVSWTSMILGYAGNGRAALALELFFSGMDVAANARTYVAALVACGDLVALESGKRVEARVYRSGVESDPVVATALVDFYGNCGDMAAGRRAFDWSSPRDVKQWNAVIGGYSRSGEIDQALSLFQRMRDERLRADAITFFSILSACSHAGEIDRARECFQAMAEFGIAPSVQHYSCLIDLFGRASRLREAVELLEAVPLLKADRVARMTVLSACQRWKEAGTGRNVFDSLLEPDDKCNSAQALVFMANANS
ncbi:pentatricopeptide repeat-containing protein At3g03580-like [Selaginella moellendorffii]|uniref:pentatricopeptide repeat-containing protein At3g03580-like n=1 Tax=Selaginella moellendorffii TaxID=88036 RepID=UPI000D1C75BE|nr:pentatricopeptide repeat-containing protein At3g03580-like [Selaginella moellendorffii]|eukprot:XP_024526503.1 pentatricopeptide repeat-containing protein At3g03580-like [Selaginella moellendorffii]